MIWNIALHIFEETAMPSSDAFALKRSGLDQFLFAAVGVEHNGMTLSPASVFARLGEDPWREAGRLAGLPKPAAIDSLARTIAGMPASPWPLADATPIATRLIALLPNPGKTGPIAAPMAARMSRFATTALFAAAIALAAAYMASALSTLGTPQPDSSHVSTFAPTDSPLSPLHGR
jgi:hypothetical protein